MSRPHALAYGPPLLVEGATVILKNLNWFETVQMLDPEFVSLQDLRPERDQLLILFAEGKAPEETYRFFRHVIISDHDQPDEILVALSSFDTLKTFRTGLLSALTGMHYRSYRHKKGVSEGGQKWTVLDSNQ